MNLSLSLRFPFASKYVWLRCGSLSNGSNGRLLSASRTLLLGSLPARTELLVDRRAAAAGAAEVVAITLPVDDWLEIVTEGDRGALSLLFGRNR